MKEPGGWIVVCNWGEFQHPDVLRSDKTIPAWIKVYTKLLHNPDYEGLTMYQRGLLTTIWLEYGASDGLLSLRRVSSAIAQIPGQRLRSDSLDSLIHAGFIRVVASRPGKQSASRARHSSDTPAETPQRLGRNSAEEHPKSLKQAGSRGSDASLEKRREEKDLKGFAGKATPSPNGVYRCPHDRLEFKSQARLDEHLHIVHEGSTA